MTAYDALVQRDLSVIRGRAQQIAELLDVNTAALAVLARHWTPNMGPLVERLGHLRDEAADIVRALDEERHKGGVT